MGEDSVFNSELKEMRDAIVRASVSDGDGALSSETGSSRPLPHTAAVVKKFGNSIVKKMIKRANTTEAAGNSNRIRHVVDKMLFNYRNIGTILCLFVKSAII
jgi:hypothetical protein